MSKTSRTFDPLNVLLRRDIWITKKKTDGKVVQILNVRLKSSKESLSTTRGIVVEVINNNLLLVLLRYLPSIKLQVFSNDSLFCPVKAYQRYINLCGTGSSNSPAFRTPTGWAYRHAAFNEDLRALLSPYIHYGKITAHSFRSGMAR